jgi:hypothetical protein
MVENMERYSVMCCVRINPILLIQGKVYCFATFFAVLL